MSCRLYNIDFTMQSIAVIAPSWKHFSNPFFHQPYWELYFATILRSYFSKKNTAVSVIDLRGHKKDDLATAIDQIPQHDIYVYWIFKTVDAQELYDIARCLKRKYPRSLHIGGGTHVELCQSESKQYFDAIIIGPGEKQFILAIEDARSSALKNIYMQSWKEVPFYDCPFPERDFLPAERIVNKDLFKLYGGGLGTMVYFSRGCCNNCAFCTLNIPRVLQERSPEVIRAEIQYLKDKYAIHGILLKEEIAIHPNPKKSAELFKVIGESNVIWKGQTSTQVSYDQLKMARESGCQELAVGVETVDENVMKAINKHWQTKKQIWDFITNARKVGIRIKLCIILGLPGEPDDIVEKTMKFVKDLEIEYVNVSGLSPLPGSDIYNHPEKYGIRYIDKNWNRYSHLIYRFSNEEDTGLPFEYADEGPWGKTFSRDRIIQNICKLQRWLQEHNRSY